MGGPAAEQSSAATQRISLHFAVKCRLHTHTYIQLRCLQNRLQPQCNPKKTALSASQIAAPAAAQRTLKLELHSHTLSPTLSRTLYFCALHILRRAQLTAAAARLRLQLQFTLHWRSLTLSLSLVFCRTQKAFCLAFL